MTLLPLHAAGRYDDEDQPLETTADRCVSSYAFTLKHLIRARRRPPAAAPKILVVAVPQTTRGEQPLTSVRKEAEMIGGILPTSHTTLIGPEATAERVLHQLRTHAGAHFASHASQDLNNPSQGAIRLYDASITVLDLAPLDLKHAELAYLSACQSAVGGTSHLDEAIHLTAAFSAAGYRHVIGTLWNVGDKASARVAEDVYSDLGHGGDIHLERTPTALHQAIRNLRRERPHEPSVWASYLHAGP